MLEIESYQAWVYDLAPVLEFTALVLNVAAKSISGMSMLNSVGISPDCMTDLLAACETTTVVGADGAIETTEGYSDKLQSWHEELSLVQEEQDATAQDAEVCSRLTFALVPSPI